MGGGGIGGVGTLFPEVHGRASGRGGYHSGSLSGGGRDGVVRVLLYVHWRASGGNGRLDGLEDGGLDRAENVRVQARDII